MKDRITQFLNETQISSAEFADKIGVQRSSVSHVLNGRNFPSASFIQKMLTAYTHLNPRWLLLGQGPMILEQNIKFEPSLFDVPTEKIRTNEPVLPVESTEKKTDGPHPTNIPVTKQDLQSTTENDTKIHTASTAQTTGLLKQLADNKNIEQIVIFYSDKTFTSYLPS